MQIKRFTMKRITYIIVLFIYLFAFSYFTHVSAEKEVEGVTVWPTFQNLVIKEGESDIITVHAKNTSDNELNMSVYFRNIKIGESPHKNVMLSEETDELPASWLSTVDSDNFIIKSGETKDIQVKIDIPASADVRGYYPAVILNFSEESEESKIISQSEIASVIYLSVSDVLGEEAEKKMFLKEFSADRKFSFIPKVTLSTEVENVGDIHFRPRGVIEVYDPKGTRQDSLVTVNDDMLYLLPQQILKDEVSWEDSSRSRFLPPIGRYKAVLSMYIEEDREQIAQSEVYFYVFPVMYVLYGIIICTVLGLIIRYVIKRRKKYYQGQ